ncbi:MAG: DMT family protein [Candidatus Andeanibacterium colombiense]|uniref:DMT family protein n=1 Tax=Candidatus Andeanibacterium colombiense TaxID=3121345 RepID=A0AAJ5X5D5_9SPHN|nr:MAG: DMT family protein [Sphingomonadaceae bacterium]
MNWNLFAPIGLLAGSNVLMNIAWYGHLKFPARALWLAILVSWGIALFEYSLAVPANRIGAKAYSLAELKTTQEVMSLLTFLGVAWFLFDQKPGISQIVGFILIGLGALFVFKAPLG